MSTQGGGGGGGEGRAACPSAVGTRAADVTTPTRTIEPRRIRRERGTSISAAGERQWPYRLARGAGAGCDKAGGSHRVGRLERRCRRHRDDRRRRRATMSGDGGGHGVVCCRQRSLVWVCRPPRAVSLTTFPLPRGSAYLAVCFMIRPSRRIRAASSCRRDIPPPVSGSPRRACARSSSSFTDVADDEKALHAHVVLGRLIDPPESPRTTFFELRAADLPLRVHAEQRRRYLRRRIPWARRRLEPGGSASSLSRRTPHSE